jgi:hypothetical protein
VLCIGSVAVGTDTAAFVGLEVGCHGGSWVCQCPVLSPLNFDRNDVT